MSMNTTEIGHSICERIKSDWRGEGERERARPSSHLISCNFLSFLIGKTFSFSRLLLEKMINGNRSNHSIKLAFISPVCFSRKKFFLFFSFASQKRCLKVES